MAENTIPIIYQGNFTAVFLAAVYIHPWANAMAALGKF